MNHARKIAAAQRDQARARIAEWKPAPPSLGTQITSDQVITLTKMLGFSCDPYLAYGDGLRSILRSIPALPDTPTMRDILDAYLDAVRERAGA